MHVCSAGGLVLQYRTQNMIIADMKQHAEQPGFVTMLIAILVVIVGVIVLTYLRVSSVNQ